MFLIIMGTIAVYVLGVWLNFRGQKIFRSLLVAAFITTGVFLIDNNFFILPKGSVVIDRIKGDFDDMETRKFITTLGNVRTSQIFISHDQIDAQKFFDTAYASGKILIGGDKNTIIVTLRPGKVVVEPFESFQLIRSVPQFAFSREPKDGTGHFLRSFSVGFKTAQADKKEMFLRDAASIQSPWRSFSHRAVPLFFLSVEKIKAHDVTDAELLLVQAAEYLRPNDNPDLRGAILNNLGIVRALRGEDSTGLFKRAAETSFERNVFNGDYIPAKTARMNLKILERRLRES